MLGLQVCTSVPGFPSSFPTYIKCKKSIFLSLDCLTSVWKRPVLQLHIPCSHLGLCLVRQGSPGAGAWVRPGSAFGVKISMLKGRGPVRSLSQQRQDWPELHPGYPDSGRRKPTLCSCPDTNVHTMLKHNKSVF